MASAKGEGRCMEYEIRHFNTPLLHFDADPSSVDSSYEITWVNEETKFLIPKGMELTSEGISSWIRHRAIPKNRAFVSTFLARNGLNSNRPLATISLCKGLSLNDCFWVVAAGDESTFEGVNLYDNRISQLLAQIAFTGYGSSAKNGFSSSPEFTTNGMLPKCWRRISGKIYLYKGGTTGFANAGFEPYSEYYAADVASVLDIAHVDYSIHRWKGILCSSCELFTSKEFSFVPAAALVKAGGFAAVRDFCLALGPQYEQALSDMLAFDALICNTDRHMNNYGFMVDNSTNALAGPAPLFDHGNSLLYQAFGDDWSSIDALQAYASAQDACIYGDFFETAKECMTRETRAKVRGALEFEFTRKPAKGFPPQRLEMIEEMIRIRAKQLID